MEIEVQLILLVMVGIILIALVVDVVGLMALEVVVMVVPPMIFMVVAQIVLPLNLEDDVKIINILNNMGNLNQV